VGVSRRVAEVAGADQVRPTADRVEAGWLTDVLRDRGLLVGGSRIISLTASPVGTGQMADTVRFALTYEPVGSGPASVIGKFASQDEQSLSTGRVMRAYEVEVRFYVDVAPRVATRIPQLLFAALDPDDSRFTLILEDLDDARQGDEIEGCDAPIATAALEQMAALHAPCWEEPELAATEWINRSSPEGDEFMAALLTGVFPGFLDRYADRLAPHHIMLLESFIPRIGEWLARERGPRTVVHADFRLDNLLFTPDRPEPVVVDFQTINWGSGAYDLAYFVGGSLEPELRRASWSDLVTGYHQGLVQRGVADYPLDALITDYRRECFGGLFMAIGASMLVKQTERGDRMFLTSVRRHAQQCIDLEALAVLDGS
jgi:hypothetical protein